MLIGYARVSTEDQTPLPQAQALKSAGCTEIFEEHASGGNRARPVLARVLERIGKGDTMVVMRIDRPLCQRSCPPLCFSSISQVGGIG
jgi:DNA invertase Pin-like site-specific DNA recombinase